MMTKRESDNRINFLLKNSSSCLMNRKIKNKYLSYLSNLRIIYLKVRKKFFKKNN